ncbi:MAG: phosphoribosylaminoimidazolesuccinocarboxamide synthase [Nitrospinota bacterium]
MVNKKDILYEGKAKVIYTTDDPSLLIQYFKDDVTAFNGAKKSSIANKGLCNNMISSHIFDLMSKVKIPNHFVKCFSDREMLVKSVQIIPLEVVMRNVIAGSLAKRIGKEEGTKLRAPILEFYYKDDNLGDPMINESHIDVFELATKEEIAHIKNEATKINNWLVDFFDRINIVLVDYKLEFGRSDEGILLADEISLDGCRLWEKSTGEKKDKDRFRQDLGSLAEVYEEMKERVINS